MSNVISLPTALKVSAALASGNEDRALNSLREMIAEQWATAADVTQHVLVSVRACTHTADEALEFLAAEFRKMARP